MSLKYEWRVKKIGSTWTDIDTEIQTGLNETPDGGWEVYSVSTSEVLSPGPNFGCYRTLILYRKFVPETMEEFHRRNSR